MSERDERIGRSVTRTFVEGVLTDRSKSGGQDRDLRKNEREVFVQNTARRNWQGSCFSRGSSQQSHGGHRNSFIKNENLVWRGSVTDTLSDKADKNIKKLSNATPNYSSDPLLIWELGLSAKANLRN